MKDLPTLNPVEKFIDIDQPFAYEVWRDHAPEPIVSRRV